MVILLHLFLLLFADFLLVVVVDQVDRVFVLLEVFQEFGGADLFVVLHVLVHLVVQPWVVGILVLCHVFALVLSFLAHDEQISLLFAISESNLPPPKSEKGHLDEL